MKDQTISLADALSKALENSDTLLQLVNSSGEASCLNELAISIEEVSFPMGASFIVLGSFTLRLVTAYTNGTN